jgi:hypothetical protein
MFENFGLNSSENKGGRDIRKTGSEGSLIPEILEDPRLDLDDIPEEPDFERINLEETNMVLEQKNMPSQENNIMDLNDFSRLTAFIKNKFDDDEERMLLKRKTEDLRENIRKTQRDSGFRNQAEYETNRELQETIIEINKRDAQRINAIIEYIRHNRTSTEGLKNINTFWKNFKDIFYEEKYERNRRSRSEKQKSGREGCRYDSPEKIKNGILGEIAARDLLEGLEDYFTDPENNEPGYEGIDFSRIKISAENSTIEEDVLEQTDLKLHISYKDMDFALPVQVKCAFLENSDSYKAKFMEDAPFILSRHNIGTYEPYGEEIRKFYKKYGDWGGAFMLIMHGCDKREIGNDGFPSHEMRLRFYEATKREIYDFLIYQLSQKSRTRK